MLGHVEEFWSHFRIHWWQNVCVTTEAFCPTTDLSSINPFLLFNVLSSRKRDIQKDTERDMKRKREHICLDMHHYTWKENIMILHTHPSIWECRHVALIDFGRVNLGTVWPHFELQIGELNGRRHIAHFNVSEVSTWFNSFCTDSLHDLYYRSRRLCWVQNLILYRMAYYFHGWLSGKK